MWERSNWASCALVACLSLATPGAWAAPVDSGSDPNKESVPSDTPTAPRATMHQVFEALSHLLPLALDEERWRSPETRREIDLWLVRLSESSRALEAHGDQRDVGFRYLSRSLSSDIEEIRYRVELERLDEAGFILMEATSNCVACHTRLPSARSFPLGDKLLSRINLEDVSVHEKAQLLVATRQFDAALKNWEDAFQSPEMTPAEIDVGGYLGDYITVAVRVQADPKRAQKTLQRLAKRDDVPLYLGRHLARWIQDLERLGPELRAGKRLDHARALVVGAGDGKRLPLGRERFIGDLIASSLLLQFIDSNPTNREQLAEALYLLGWVEARSVDSYWVPQSEFHLEAAVRLAPQADFAEDAYALLEENLIVGYGGASSEELPTDAWMLLEELRKLIDKETQEIF
jgi:hypothetical protein